MVTASFNEIIYSFGEGAGQSSGIYVNLTKQIAQDLSISIFAGMYSVAGFAFAALTFIFITQFTIDPGQQPDTVEVSGFTVNTTITFTPSSSTSQMLPGFVIKNDDVALESVESYSITLVSSDPSISFGPASTIEITDDDGNKINDNLILLKKSYITL